ncbi:carboxylating nicotinate-nucleotide diphosphorylase [Campylobacter sp. 19-13652]|uniref:carboxylating nicotinate-nucleotide diphosphorylase n=1 Tax=Campylobacter sp. 19-13652 TaxID=2840180 RepID=UPI001C7735F2|nr:carboxylating nicotinate-nucleotide diphosphorylase [Campylobacter sp. 19-13652]BCX78920.1 putative nicotinate-nucleotide pyrophosphorylase [carboxylating] [Campylobacter sp. 19-13652]
MFESLIKKAYDEDIGRGDLFSLVSSGSVKEASIKAKQDGVFAGEVALREACEMAQIELSVFKFDGDGIKSGDEIARLRADERVLLRWERTILNFIQHASGIATMTAKFVKQISGSGAGLLDTRKTRPGLRVYEKYAVRCGGGSNHRLGLDDALMLKDSHLDGVADWALFFSEARKKMPFTTKIEVECDNFEQASKAMAAGADIIMCDNMGFDEIARIKKLRDESYPAVLLEASGNISLATARDYAFSGVDAISTGSTIHQAVWLDFSMRLA